MRKDAWEGTGGAAVSSGPQATNCSRRAGTLALAKPMSPPVCRVGFVAAAPTRGCLSKRRTGGGLPPVRSLAGGCRDLSPGLREFTTEQGCACRWRRNRGGSCRGPSVLLSALPQAGVPRAGCDHCLHHRATRMEKLSPAWGCLHLSQPREARRQRPGSSPPNTGGRHPARDALPGALLHPDTGKSPLGSGRLQG